MMVVHKYQLSLAGSQHINLPAGYKILDIQWQRTKEDHIEHPQMWVLHEYGAPCTEYVHIICYLTGHQYHHTPIRHIKTLVGTLVLHYFEETQNHGD